MTEPRHPPTAFKLPEQLSSSLSEQMSMGALQGSPSIKSECWLALQNLHRWKGETSGIMFHISKLKLGVGKWVKKLNFEAQNLSIIDQSIPGLR